MNTRNKNLDLIRTLAIILVIFNHVVEIVYNLDYENSALLSFPTTYVASTCYTIGRLGVPLFLLLTGYLLLDREWTTDSIRLFWRRNWLPLVLVSELWIVINYIYSNWFFDTKFSIITLMKDMLFLKTQEMTHLWYIPMIIGLYILIPFVGIALQNCDRKILILPIIIYTIISLIIPPLNILFNTQGHTLTTYLSLGYSAGNYGIALTIGYLCKKKVFSKTPTYILLSSLVLSICLGMAMMVYVNTHGVFYKIWYDNILLLIGGFCLFELLTRVKTIPTYQVYFQVSYYSFAMYLTHNIVLKTIWKFNNQLYCLPASRAMQIIVLTIIDFVLTFIACWIIGKIPIIGKKCLNLK